MANQHSIRRLLIASIALPLLLLTSCGRTPTALEPQARSGENATELVVTAKEHPHVQIALEAVQGSGYRVDWNQATTVKGEEFVGLQVPIDGVAAVLSLTYRDGTILDASLLRMREDSFPVCHVPRNNGDESHTLVLPHSALSAHLSHGDELFPCPGDSDFADFEVVVVSLAFGEVGVFGINDGGKFDVTAVGTWAGTATLEELTTVVPMSEVSCTDCNLSLAGAEVVVDPGGGGGTGSDSPPEDENDADDGDSGDGGSEDPADSGGGTDGDGADEGPGAGTDDGEDAHYCDPEVLEGYQTAIDYSQGLFDDAQWAYSQADAAANQAEIERDSARAVFQMWDTKLRDIEAKKTEYEEAQKDHQDKKIASRHSRSNFILALASESAATLKLGAMCAAKFGKCAGEITAWELAVATKLGVAAEHMDNRDAEREARERERDARDDWMAVEDDYAPTMQERNAAEEALATAELAYADARSTRTHAFGVLEDRRYALEVTKEAFETYKEMHDC